MTLQSHEIPPDSVNKKNVAGARIVLTALAVVLSVYVALRACYVSLTHDEAFTFFSYIKQPWEFTLEVKYTNNHLLNSVLAKLSSTMLGESEFALRLPNVLGGILFFVCAARILVNLKPAGWFAPLAFVALAGNAFMIDFFSLCRGYGLSMGLLAAALLFQQMVFLNKRKSIFIMLSLLCSACAVTANYTLFNFFLIHFAFNFIHEVFRIRSVRKDRRKALISTVTTLMITGAALWYVSVMLKMLLNLNTLGNFNFGGTSGFWQDTVWSLVMQSCFPIINERNWLLVFVPVVAAVLFACAAYVALKQLKQRDFSAPVMFIVFLLISLTGCVAAMVAQHYILGVFYSADRTALYFIPLFSLLLLNVCAYRFHFITAFRVLTVIYFIPFVAAVLSFVNTDRVIFWANDRHMKEFTAAVLAQAEEIKHTDVPLIVAVPFEIYPSLNYYLYRSGQNSIQLARFDEITWWHLADIGVTFEDNNDSASVDPAFMRITKYEGKILHRRVNPLNFSKIKNVGSEDFENNKADKRYYEDGFNSPLADRVWSEQKYARDIDYVVPDSIPANCFYITSCQIKSKCVSSRALAVFSVERNGELIMWKGWDVGPMLSRQGEWQEITVRMHADVNIQSGDVLNFYISTDGDSDFLLDDYRVDEFRIVD
jgi:hypothetical protein